MERKSWIYKAKVAYNISQRRYKKSTREKKERARERACEREIEKEREIYFTLG